MPILFYLIYLWLETTYQPLNLNLHSHRHYQLQYLLSPSRIGRQPLFLIPPHQQLVRQWSLDLSHTRLPAVMHSDNTRPWISTWQPTIYLWLTHAIGCVMIPFFVVTFNLVTTPSDQECFCPYKSPLLLWSFVICTRVSKQRQKRLSSYLILGLPTSSVNTSSLGPPSHSVFSVVRHWSPVLEPEKRQIPKPLKVHKCLMTKLLRTVKVGSTVTHHGFKKSVLFYLIKWRW